VLFENEDLPSLVMNFQGKRIWSLSASRIDENGIAFLFDHIVNIKELGLSIVFCCFFFVVVLISWIRFVVV